MLMLNFRALTHGTEISPSTFRAIKTVQTNRISHCKINN
jgi:hypothetical protein